ncbi:MAG: glycosyltransferase [Thermodesulfobacteriota bacterium]|nr:glycosyltransferase [Thermodesulfobacteriota bacterium]
MPVFIKNNNNLLFVHVPKTGGSSAEELFKKSGWRIACLDKGSQGTLNHLRPCSPQHMHAKMLQQQFVLCQFNGIFMIVRHPYDRFCSEYCYINKNNCDFSSKAVENWTRKIFCEYTSNNFILDNHIRPQNEFYIPGSTVYKLEDGFDSIKQDLNGQYGIEFVAEDIRVMCRKTESGFSSKDIALNATVKNMLNIMYSQDFIQFGYKPDNKMRHTTPIDTFPSTNTLPVDLGQTETKKPTEKKEPPEINKNDLTIYNLWIQQHKFIDSDLNFFSNIISLQEHHSIIHILINISKGEEILLADTIDSIGAQVYTNWCLSVVADFTCPDPLFEELDQLQWIVCSNNMATTSIEVLESVEADLVVSMKPGDILDSAFLYFIYLYTETNPSWKFIYTDEDTIDNEGNFVSPKFKPDCNLDLIRSTNYIGDACVIKKEALSKLQKTGTFDCTNNYDLFLRSHDAFGEQSIGHISKLLFHSFDREDKNLNNIKSKYELSSLKKHFKRNNILCTISEGVLEKTYFVKYELNPTSLVSIIIPTKDNVSLLQKCISSLFEKTDYKNYEIIIIDNNSTDPETISYLKSISVSHPAIRVLSYTKPFNYSAINNFAVKEAKGEYLLLLNDDTEILQGFWLDRMLQHAQRKDVGAVGARLIYSNKRLQHAGIILGLFGLAHHPGINRDMTEPGYMNRFQVVQNFSAVTAACLLVKKSRYLEVGGLDEEGLKVLFNDVDFCLKLGKAGYRNVWTPYVTLIHHGSSSLGKKTKKTKKDVKKTIARVQKEHQIMKERWTPILINDPAYNKNLSLKKFNWNLDTIFPVPWDQNIADRLKIAAIPNSSAGSTHYRISSPFHSLRKSGVAWDTIFPTPKQNRMPNVIDLSRIAPDSLLLHSVFCKQDLLKEYKQQTKTFLIYGLDDFLSQVPANNPTQILIPKDINSRLKGMISQSDRFIVSTEPLYDHFKKKNIIDDIRILPNCLDGDRWMTLQSLKRQGKKIRIGWAGAIQHHGDLNIITEVIKETHKEVDWIFMGMCPENIRDFVLEFHPSEHFDKYPAKLASLNLDLAVAPLEINKFNEAKSNLRLLEYGVLGIPVIATDIFPYQNSPAKTVCNEKDQWIAAIRERVADIDAAEKEGDSLKKWVLDTFLLENNLELWLNALTP